MTIIKQSITYSWAGVANGVYFQLKGGSWDCTSSQCRGWWSPSNSHRLVFLDLNYLRDCYDHVHQLVQKGCHRPPYCVGSNQFPFHFYVSLAGTICFQFRDWKSNGTLQYFILILNHTKVPARITVWLPVSLPHPCEHCSECAWRIAVMTNK